jgi:hypothetical protein
LGEKLLLRYPDHSLFFTVYLKPTMFLIIEFCHIFVCSALFFPPVEKRLSLPPRLTPLSTNNFVRCTLQNRIIKSLFSKVRRKNKNKKNTSFKLHMKNINNNKFSLQQQNNVCLRHSPSPTTFLLYRSLQHCLIMMTKTTN